jgi:DNA-binding protein HU-beta
MNKQELIASIASNKDSSIESKAGAERALNAVMAAISDGIKKDGEVQLIGFGTFKVKARPARKGRNPATGEAIKIKASKSVTFKCGSELKALAKKAKVK